MTDDDPVNRPTIRAIYAKPPESVFVGRYAPLDQGQASAWDGRSPLTEWPSRRGPKNPVCRRLPRRVSKRNRWHEGQR